MCSDPIEAFCQRHFSWRGAWRLNRRAIGWDLWRVIFNLLYAPLWLLMQILAAACSLLGLLTAARLLHELPVGLMTDVHRQLAQALRAELLQLANTSEHLGHEIADNAIQQYLARRAATAEIFASLLCLCVGFLAFNKMTPGGVSLGREIADTLNWQHAVSGFWAGDWLGQLWYGWFPPQTPMWLTLLSMLLAFIALAILAALSGCLIDPVQTSIGLHQYRLRRWHDALQNRLKRSPKTPPPEPLLARGLDALDWLRL